MRLRGSILAEILMIKREITGKITDASKGISYFEKKHRFCNSEYCITIELTDSEKKEIVREYLLNNPKDDFLSDLGLEKVIEKNLEESTPKYIGVYNKNQILFCGKVIDEFGDQVTYEPITEDDVLALTMPFLDDSFLLIGNEELKKDTKKANIEAIKRDGCNVVFSEEPSLFIEDLKKNPYLVSRNIQNLNSDKDWILNSVPLF